MIRRRLSNQPHGRRQASQRAREVHKDTEVDKKLSGPKLGSTVNDTNRYTFPLEKTAL